MFVVGAFDSRITFYSQQVRALSLVHALRDQGILADGLRVGVVGGGAAGTTAAVAAALISDITVDLYERADDVLPLQRATERRRLDPHIYGWPEIGSDDPNAELPLLDWTAGPARNVRRDVKQEFDAAVAAVSPRLRVHLRHQVTVARAVADGLQLDFERAPLAGEAPAVPGATIPGQTTVDILILAFGFGLEDAQAVAGAPSISYWSEAGIPVAEFEGRAAPRFLISGNGDGGLIDLVAAGSAHFDHAGMIREICNQANMAPVKAKLEAIDARALAAFRAGAGFDFLAAYDAEIRQDLEGLGLLDLVANRLRPGVRLTLQTLLPEAFSIATATLNRVAAYLIARACERVAQTEFIHISGDDLTVTAVPPGAAYEAPLWFTCAGQTFGVDAAIVRHGPGRALARQPFGEVLGNYAETHQAWLTMHGDAVVAPSLAEEVRGVFVRAARAVQLPLPAYVQRRLADQQPTLVRVQAYGGGIRWSGDVAPNAVGDLWNPGANAIDILSPGPPAQLGPAAAPLVRMALHANRAEVQANAADWRPFADPLTSGSAHAEHLIAISIRPAPPAGAARNIHQLDALNLAVTLSAALSGWVLNTAHAQINDFVLTGRDPSNWIGFGAGHDLRARMGQIWGNWRNQFTGDAALLDRFLRLTICAEDNDDRQDEARVLVGPRKLPQIVRAIAAALAVAAAWPDTAPRAERPGNLSRAIAGGDPWHGHACGADLIARQPTAIAAVTFMWRTHFVVLSQLNQPLALATGAQASLAVIEQLQPSIAEPTGAGGIILTLDAAFRTAANAGLAALTALLASVQTEHFERLKAAIVEE